MAPFMASERMMQAMGRIEQALARIEGLVEIRLAQPPSPKAAEDSQLRTEAAEALQSLDALIAELKGSSNG